MAGPVMTYTTWTRLVTKLATATSCFTDLLLALYTNNYTPSVGSVEGDFTEATFTGYAATAVDDTVVTPFMDALDNFGIAFAHIPFQPSADLVAPEAIYGWYITGNFGGVGPLAVVNARRFDSPVTLSRKSDILIIEPRIFLANAADLAA